MSSVSMIVLCASALFVQSISAYCHGAPAPSCGCGRGIVESHLAAASGGGLGVTTSSRFAPKGLSVLSENEISGILEASGNLPLLAAVALEGTLPTVGEAGTIYSCGNGQVGITSDSIAAAGIDAAGYGSGYGAAALGRGAYARGPYAHGACGYY